MVTRGPNHKYKYPGFSSRNYPSLSQGLLLLCSVFILTACKKSGDFKEIRDFPKNEWYIAHKQTFEFNITDTSSTYRFNYLVRNSVSYPFYNLYLQQKLTDSSGTQLSGSMDEVILFDEKSGKPYGDGMGDIFDCRIQAPKLQNMKFSTAGKYRWIDRVSHTQIQKKSPYSL